MKAVSTSSPMSETKAICTARLAPVVRRLPARSRRAGSSHAGSLRRRGDTGEDRPQHRDDEHDRRHQRGEDLAHGQVLARLRHGGRGLRPDERDQHLPADIEAHQHQPRQQRPREEIADGDGIGREVAHLHLRLLVGAGELVAEDDEHDGGRNDLAERTGRRDAAAGERRRIAVPQHRRQRHQPHGDDGGPDDAGGGGEQRADQRDRERQPAVHPPEQAAHRFQQVFRDARALQHHAHEDEQRHGDQHLVGHLPEDARRQGRQRQRGPGEMAEQREQEGRRRPA